jgi:hypothetical protein
MESIPFFLDHSFGEAGKLLENLLKIILSTDVPLLQSLMSIVCRSKVSLQKSLV